MPALDLAALDRDGWTAVPGVLEPAAAAALAERCMALLGEGDDLRQGDKRGGGTRRAAELLDRLPEIRDLFEHPTIESAVIALLGAAVPITDVAFRCPQPGFGRQSLHADNVPNTTAEESRAVTCIVALCDFTDENGATAVVPGSHRRPDLQRRPNRLREDDEIRLTGAAGTAFVFSAHLLHRGTENRSTGPRPALQAQWRLPTRYGD
jgi:hypothetical protein